MDKYLSKYNDNIQGIGINLYDLAAGIQLQVF